MRKWDYMSRAGIEREGRNTICIPISFQFAKSKIEYMCTLFSY